MINVGGARPPARALWKAPITPQAEPELVACVQDLQARGIHFSMNYKRTPGFPTETLSPQDLAHRITAFPSWFNVLVWDDQGQARALDTVPQLCALDALAVTHDYSAVDNPALAQRLEDGPLSVFERYATYDRLHDAKRAIDNPNFKETAPRPISPREAPALRSRLQHLEQQGVSFWVYRPQCLQDVPADDLFMHLTSAPVATILLGVGNATLETTSVQRLVSHQPLSQNMRDMAGIWQRHLKGGALKPWQAGWLLEALSEPEAAMKARKPTGLAPEARYQAIAHLLDLEQGWGNDDGERPISAPDAADRASKDFGFLRMAMRPEERFEDALAELGDYLGAVKQNQAHQTFRWVREHQVDNHDATARQRFVSLLRTVGSLEVAGQAHILLEQAVGSETYEDRLAMLRHLTARQQSTGTRETAAAEAVADYEAMLRHRLPQQSLAEAFGLLDAIGNAVRRNEGGAAVRGAYSRYQDALQTGGFPGRTAEEATRELLRYLVLGMGSERALDLLGGPPAEKHAGGIDDDDGDVTIGGVHLTPYLVPRDRVPIFFEVPLPPPTR